MSEYNDHIRYFFHSIQENLNVGQDIIVCYEDVSWQRMFCVPARLVFKETGKYATRFPKNPGENIYSPSTPPEKLKELEHLYLKLNFKKDTQEIFGNVVPNYSSANLYQNEKIDYATDVA